MERKIAKSIIDSVINSLKEERKKKNMSHETIAEISGLHRSTISLIESRKREATLLTLLKIADALECDLGQLISQAAQEA